MPSRAPQTSPSAGPAPRSSPGHHVAHSRPPGSAGGPPPGAEKALAGRGAGCAVLAAEPVPSRRRWRVVARGRGAAAAGRGAAQGLTRQKNVRGGGAGAAGSRPYLALTHGLGGWGAPGRTPKLPGLLHCGRGGGDGGQWGAWTSWGGGDVWAAPSSLARPPRQASRSLQFLDPPLPLSSQGPAAPAQSVPWEAFLPPSQVWLFPGPREEACQRTLYPVKKAAFRRLRMWGVRGGWEGPRRDRPPGPVTIQPPSVSAPVKREGGGEDTENEWPERATQRGEPQQGAGFGGRRVLPRQHPYLLLVSVGGWSPTGQSRPLHSWASGAVHHSDPAGTPCPPAWTPAQLFFSGPR